MGCRSLWENSQVSPRHDFGNCTAQLYATTIRLSCLDSQLASIATARVRQSTPNSEGWMSPVMSEAIFNGQWPRLNRVKHRLRARCYVAPISHVDRRNNFAACATNRPVRSANMRVPIKYVLAIIQHPQNANQLPPRESCHHMH